MSKTKVHRLLKWIWIVLTIPIVLFLRDSVPFLVGISVYAVVVGHWSAEEAAEGE